MTVRRLFRARTATSILALAACLGPVPVLAQSASSAISEVERSEPADDDAQTVVVRQPAKKPATKITVEGLALQRDDIESIPLTTAGDPGNDPFVAFKASELDPETGAGIRASIETELLGVPIDITGFYTGNMLSRKAKNDLDDNGFDTDAAYNLSLPDINDDRSTSIEGFIAEHQTQLLSAEINARQAFGIRPLLFGLRTLYLAEHFTTAASEDENDFPRNPADPDTFDAGDLDNDIDVGVIEANNLLVGLQIGLEGMVEVARGVSLGGSAKAGIYANFHERLRGFQTEEINTSASGPPTFNNRIRDEVNDVGTATAFELNPRLNVELADGVSLTASGMFLWINDVSEATSYFAEITNRQNKDNDNNGDVFFYGGTLGLTFDLDKVGESGGEAPASASLKAGPDYVVASTPADIEERIADLEATTVRKGNRAVSLEVTGQVNKMLMYFEDGEIQDAYIVDNSTSGTRFFFEGQGQISRSWSAGFDIGLDVNRSSRSSGVNQEEDETDDPDLRIREAAWWLRNNKYGRITVGQTSPATDNITLYNLGNTAGVASADTRLIGGGLNFRRSQRPYEDQFNDIESLNGSLEIDDFLPGLDTARRDGIRYDTRSYYGFIASAFWGEDDFWDVALRWRRSWRDWAWRVGIGYLEDTDFDDDAKEIEIKGSAALRHVPSGLFIHGAYLHREFEGTGDSVRTEGIVTPDDANLPDYSYWYLQGGIRKRWSSLGETSVFGEYAKSEDALTGKSGAGAGGFDETTSSELHMIGGGIVQEIEAANAELYVGFRHFGNDVTGVDEAGQNDEIENEVEIYNDINIVYSGMRIKF